MFKKWMTGLLALGLVGCHSETVLKAADGKTIRIPASDHRYMAINYWALWCESCREEVASMNHLAVSASKKIRVLGVNFDRLQGGALQKAGEKMKIAYPLLAQGALLSWRLTPPEVLPATYLLSDSHQVIKKFYGKDSAAQIKRWLAQQSQ